MVRKRNFAHVLEIVDGWPPAYARAAGAPGPLVVLTFRTSAMLADVLREVGPRYFYAPWGTRWGTKVVGIKLDRTVDWREIEALLVQSYRCVATRAQLSRLNARAHRA